MEGDSIHHKRQEFKGSEEHLIDIFDIKVCINPSILFFCCLSFLTLYTSFRFKRLTEDTGLMSVL